MLLARIATEIQPGRFARGGQRWFGRSTSGSPIVRPCMECETQGCANRLISGVESDAGGSFEDVTNHTEVTCTATTAAAIRC